MLFLTLMNDKSTTTPPTGLGFSKKTLVLLAVSAVLLLGGGVFAWWKVTFPPQPNWYVRWQIWSFIKQQTGNSNFKHDFKFTEAKDLTPLQNSISLLESNLAPKQAELNLLWRDVASLNRELSPVWKELNPLRNRVENLQREIPRKQQQLEARQKELASLLAAKIPPFVTNFPPDTLSNVDALAKEIAALKTATDPVTQPLQPLRDAMAALQGQMQQKHQSIATQRRDIAALQSELGLGKRRRQNTNDPAALSLEEKTALTNKIAALTTAIAPVTAEIDALQKDFASRRAELNEKQKSVQPQLNVLGWLTNRRENLVATQASSAALKTELAALTAELAEKQKQIDDKQKPIAAKQAAFNDKQQAANAKVKAIKPQTDELDKLRKELAAQTKDFGPELGTFYTSFKSKYDSAQTYAQMYALLGRQLWSTEQLIDNPSSQMKRVGMLAAQQSANFTMDPIQNPWLAARIAEAYLLPNFNLADHPSHKHPLNPDTFLRMCRWVYQSNDENDLYLHSMEDAVEKTINPRNRDLLYYEMSRQYENIGDYQSALDSLRSIKDTNGWNSVLRHASQLEARLKHK